MSNFRSVSETIEGVVKMAKESDAGICNAIMRDAEGKPLMAIVVIRENIDEFLAALYVENDRQEQTNDSSTR